MQCAEGREVPLTLFCVLADQQRAAARDVPAGSDSDDRRQMMKLLRVQRQRAMHGGATLPPEFLSPPLFRSLRWRLSCGGGEWRMDRMADSRLPSKKQKIGNPENLFVPRFCRRAMGDVAGENVATHFRTRSGDPVHWTYQVQPHTRIPT